MGAVIAKILMMQESRFLVPSAAAPLDLDST